MAKTNAGESVIMGMMVGIQGKILKLPIIVPVIGIALCSLFPYAHAMPIATRITQAPKPTVQEKTAKILPIFDE